MRGSVAGLIAIVGLGAGCGVDEPAAGPDPGRVTLRRLNRVEYARTLYDLLEVEVDPATLPPDATEGGFDTIATALSVSPLHVETYARVAELAARQAMLEPLTGPLTLRIEAEDDPAAAVDGDGAWVGEGDRVEGTIDVGWEGRYTLTITLDPALTEGSATLLVDGAEVEALALEADAEALHAEAWLVPGERTVSLRLDEGEAIRVDALVLTGPADFDGGPNPVRDRILACDPTIEGVAPCARSILEPLGLRLWRRPLTPTELDRLVGRVEAVVADGEDFAWGVELALQSLLVAPDFVFRVEDPASGPLDDFALATRLSYFLWGTSPDDTLLALAAEGRLRRADVLREQTDRLLDDPRAVSLVDDFGGQWLLIRAVDEVSPDPWAWPTWDETLRQSAKGEMKRLFSRYLFGDADFREMLTTPLASIDSRLAEHYGVEDRGLPGTWTANLSGVGRGGWLGQAGALTVLSYPSRTSPVIRGKWVLESLLCRQPPPPPPGVEGLMEEIDPTATLRERLELHRTDPVCAACHAEMDPIGFGLENFDGVGAWRDEDAGQPVDASGVLPDGRAFDGMQELAALIAEDPDLADCVAEKVFSYAVGRLPDDEDPHIADLGRSFEASGYRFRELIHAVVQSPAFRLRGEGP